MKSRSEETIENPALPQLSGDLTLEKWRQWTSSELQKSMKNVTVQRLSVLDLIYSQLHNYYDVISDSKWLVSNFFALPYALKSVLLELLQYPVKASTLESFFKLFLEFDDLDPSKDFANQPYSEFFRSIRMDFGMLSLKLRNAAEMFDNMCEREHVVIINNVIPSSAFMLSRLVGEDRFAEIISECSRHKTKIPVGAFINLVKRWDELSEYPLAWSIRLVQS